jgi:hypothetical protein
MSLVLILFVFLIAWAGSLYIDLKCIKHTALPEQRERERARERMCVGELFDMYIDASVYMYVGYIVEGYAWVHLPYDRFVCIVRESIYIHVCLCVVYAYIYICLYIYKYNVMHTYTFMRSSRDIVV